MSGLRIINGRHPATGDSMIVVRGLVGSEQPTDELICSYIADAVNATEDAALEGWMLLAQERANDSRLNLEEVIEALEYYEERVDRALARRGLHTEWLDGGYLIYRDEEVGA